MKTPVREGEEKHSLSNAGTRHYLCAIVFPLSTVLFWSSVGAHMGILKCPMWALSITLMSITCPHGYTTWDPFVSGIPIAPVAALKAQPLASLFRHRRPDNVSYRRRSRRLDERHVKRRRRDP